RLAAGPAARDVLHVCGGCARGRAAVPFAATRESPDPDSAPASAGHRLTSTRRRRASRRGSGFSGPAHASVNGHACPGRQGETELPTLFIRTESLMSDPQNNNDDQPVVDAVGIDP